MNSVKFASWISGRKGLGFLAPLVILLAGCTGVNSVTNPPPVVVTVTPNGVSVQTGQTQQFTATVTGATNTAVTWSLSSTSASAGSLGTISATGMYTAPATVPTGGTVTVSATSQADTSKVASVTVTVTAPAITVTLSPKTPSVQAGLTQQFTAVVANDPQNKGVSWTLTGSSCSGATCGALSASSSASGQAIVYTAPTAVPSGTVTIKATSAADNTKSDSTTITVTAAPVISVALSPTAANVQAGIGTQNFTATLTNDTGSKGVTWSLSGTGCSGATCGTLTNVTATSVTYNSPASAPSPAAVTLKATSVADTTKNATAAITVTTGVAVSIAPTSATLNVTKTKNFIATVSNDSQNKGVNWTLSGAGCSGATCGSLSATSSPSGTAIVYTAPATVPSPALVTIKATSVADPSASFSSTITVVPAVSVSVGPSIATVTVGLTQTFTATVTNDLLAQGVNWTLGGAGCSGATCGGLSTTASASGVAITYTAPATVPTPATVTLTATSVTDNTKTGSATITVAPLPISVTLSPKTPSVQVGLTQQFTATVTNTSNTGVTWQVNGVTGGAAATGTISTTGLYTAPASVPTGTITVAAISQADSTKSDSTTVTITTAPPIVVTLAPTSASVQAGIGTQNFTATLTNDTGNKGVTWSISGTGCSGATCGTLTNTTTTTVTYNAPASVPSPATVTLLATSIADGTKSTSVAITVTAAIGVSVSPASASVNVGKTQGFTATVTNDSQNKGVNWALSGAGCAGATCGALSTTTSASGVAITYTAPAAVPSPATVTIKATSVADGARSFSSTITVVPAISVAVAPLTATVNLGLTQSFAATVSNDLLNQGVTWALTGAGCSGATCGTLSSASSASGVAITYTPPAAVPSPATVTLTATSVTDATHNGAATITVAPAISVAVAPATATVNVGLTQSFTATVSNDGQNKGVTWTLSGAGCSGSTCGTLSASSSSSGTPITYTAPAAVPSPATVTIKATSVADGTRSFSSTITVAPAISVVVSPLTATVNVGLTQSFTATVSNDGQNQGVTWTLSGTGCSGATCGSLSTTSSASGVAITYTAPTSVPSPASVTLTAKSVSDTSRTGTATITVAPAISVAIAPTSASVNVTKTQSFTATVTNDSQNKGVNWTLSGTGCSGSTCGTLSASSSASGVAITYTAPASVPSPATVSITATSVADGTKSFSATITVLPAISVAVAPTTATVTVSLTQNFTATVSNDAQNKGVNWTLAGTGCSGATCGALSATTSASGVAITYTAPATVPSPATVTLTATSVADGTKTGTATITVQTAVVSGLSVAITPVRGGLTIGQSMNFTATVTNDVGAAGVSWSVTGGGSFPASTITSATYTAPATAGSVTVTATSIADITKSASATIGVTDLAGVATYHNNISRDGANTREFALTTTNVAKATFGKLFACTVDAAVYAQPLWVPNLTIGGTQHNVIIAVTQHDSIYVFDADASPCVTLWSKVGTSAGSLLPSGETWVTSGSSGTVDVPCGDLAPAIGIVGTPVVDLSTNTIYLVTKSKATSPVAFHQRLHALDITTGAEKFGGPVEISGSQASATFTPLKNNQRAGLALVNGNVYISWASHCDQGAYQGWVMAYSASTLSQTALFTPAPSATTSIESGIWMAGGAPAADSSNNLYLITGNGTFNPVTNDFGDSLLKLATTSGISMLDYFAPHTQASDQSSDADLGSGGAAILVDQPSGPVQHLVIGGGKDGILFLLNRDNLGHNNSTDSGAIQLLDIGASIYATPAFWNNKLYIGGTFGNNHVQAFTFNTTTGKFGSPNSSQSPTSYGFPGTTPSVSANGTSQGILWAIDAGNNGTDGSTFGAAVLHAYDATNLATELWNSTQASGDAAGTAVKFTVPTVANGKVYVGTLGEISVYGLKPN